MQKTSVCIFGEVLFDCFPDGRKVLGGAPFNVAWHLQAFGAAPRFLSAVGDDEDGARIRAGMRDWGMDTSALHTDPDHPSGSVQVTLENGDARYDIVYPSAYDFIRLPAQNEPCTLLYHGSLALRGPVSAATLEMLKHERPDLVFVDVNLRAPWWSRESLDKQITDADWVKLNADEFALLATPEDLAPRTMEEQARHFLTRNRLRGLVITRGEAGALAILEDSEPVRVAPRPALEVIDTVGAGDAFSSIVILGILHGWPLVTTLERAQSFASLIVGQRGAIQASARLYQSLSAQWQLPGAFGEPQAGPQSSTDTPRLQPGER